jgi:hypothetical protein
MRPCRGPLRHRRGTMLRATAARREPAARDAGAFQTLSWVVSHEAKRVGSGVFLTPARRAPRLAGDQRPQTAASRAAAQGRKGLGSDRLDAAFADVPGGMPPVVPRAAAPAPLSGQPPVRVELHAAERGQRGAASSAHPLPPVRPRHRVGECGRGRGRGRGRHCGRLSCGLSHPHRAGCPLRGMHAPQDRRGCAPKGAKTCAGVWARGAPARDYRGSRAQPLLRVGARPLSPGSQR